MRAAGTLLIGLLWAIGGSLCWSVQASRPATSKEPEEIIKIADGIYARVVSPDSAAVSNSGFVVLEQSVIVFDTHFTAEAGQALLSKLRAISPKPVRYVIYSHFHSDHTHGTQVFAGAPQVISSSAARRDVLQKDLPSLNRSLGAAKALLDKLKKELGQAADPAQKASLSAQLATRGDYVDRMSRLKIVVPNITLDDRLNIVEGTRRVELFSLGVGHTDGDIVLFLPAEKVVFAGDLFFNAALPNTQDCSILEWMKTLDELLKLDADKFVPGHGAVGTKDDVRAFQTYLQELRALVEPAIERGDSMEQVLEETMLPGKYAAHKFTNFFESNLQKMYAELKSLQTAPRETPAEPESTGETEK